jgi:hypothetical protein
MDEELNHFAELLAIACSRIGAEYFQLPVADADAVYRERVYCYELYHQLRCLWRDFRFSLGGEVDKEGHPHFENGPYAGAKPDFLVHWPGNMDGNLACVEVKPGTRSVGAFNADLRKLTWFHRSAGYHGGILLVYGREPEIEGWDARVREKVLRAIRGDAEIDAAAIRVLFHGGPLQEPGIIRLDEPAAQPPKQAE